jgi:hypothetical protein
MINRHSRVFETQKKKMINTEWFLIYRPQYNNEFQTSVINKTLPVIRVAMSSPVRHYLPHKMSYPYFHLIH